jgi:hypothetical protein
MTYEPLPAEFYSGKGVNPADNYEKAVFLRGEIRKLPLAFTPLWLIPIKKDGSDLGGLVHDLEIAYQKIAKDTETEIN